MKTTLWVVILANKLDQWTILLRHMALWHLQPEADRSLVWQRAGHREPVAAVLPTKDLGWRFVDFGLRRHVLLQLCRNLCLGESWRSACKRLRTCWKIGKKKNTYRSYSTWTQWWFVIRCNLPFEEIWHFDGQVGKKWWSPPAVCRSTPFGAWWA